LLQTALSKGQSTNRPSAADTTRKNPVMVVGGDLMRPQSEPASERINNSQRESHYTTTI